MSGSRQSGPLGKTGTLDFEALKPICVKRGRGQRHDSECVTCLLRTRRTAHGCGRHDRPASVTATTTMLIGSCDDRGPHPTEHRWHARGKEQRRMSVTPNDYVAAPNDVVAAAREFIRGEGDACVVSIYRLLHELSDKFGDRFLVLPNTYEVLDLIETLWADQHVDQVPDT